MKNSLFAHLLASNQKYGNTPEDIVKTQFQCAPEQIREKVILAPWWDPKIFEPYAMIAPLSVCGHTIVWNLQINKERFPSVKGNAPQITYIKTGIGAPPVLDTVLTLGCTPCKKIIFIGSVGALQGNMGIGDVVIPQYSICGDGASRYLTDKIISETDCLGEKYYPDDTLFKSLCAVTQSHAEQNHVKWHVGYTFSTDTIFAQYAHLDEILSFGCNSIEMETAAFFKAASLCQMKAGAVFCVSDNTLRKKSLYSGRTEEEMAHRKEVKRKVIPPIILQALLGL